MHGSMVLLLVPLPLEAATRGTARQPGGATANPDVNVMRHKNRSKKRPGRATTPSPKSPDALIRTLGKATDAIMPATRALWERRMDDWAMPRSQQRVSEETHGNAINIGFNLLMAAAALLTEPDPHGKSAQAISNTDQARGKQPVSELSISLAEAIIHDMKHARIIVSEKRAQEAPGTPAPAEADQETKTSEASTHGGNGQKTRGRRTTTMSDDYPDEHPQWGNPMYRHFRLENNRVVVYWATLSRARLGPEDFGKIFG